MFDRLVTNQDNISSCIIFKGTIQLAFSVCYIL